MSKVQKVSSSEFAGKFGHWAFAAQSAPVMVTDRKTGVAMGYFVSAKEFSAYLKLRDRLPKSGFIWDMSADMAAGLEKSLPNNFPEGKPSKKK